MHTSPLEQPGSGDAGGLNVYVRNSALQLGELGFHVDIFTRATRPSQGAVIELSPNVRVINIVAGPYEGLDKSELPSQMVAFAGGVLEWTSCHKVSYDLIHSHYWMSGQVGWLLRDLWRVPLIHTAHTLALVKNKFLAAGDAPEPESRRICEQQIIDNADRLVVNTVAEEENLVNLYDAVAERIEVVAPGADLEAFSPGSDRATERSRRELGIPLNAKVVAFVGRFQKLKGPHVLLRAVAELVNEHPEIPIRVLMCGGPSGLASGVSTEGELGSLARDLGISHVVRFLSPRPPEELVTIYRAADIVAVPSFNESFGLVALEAQASGTPVLASKVGGLPIAVDDGVTGLLVDGHDPLHWAHALKNLVTDDQLRISMGEAAAKHALDFSWRHSAEKLGGIYLSAIQEGARVPCHTDRAGE